MNSLYLDIGWREKRRMYDLGFHASTLYPNSFSSSATSRKIATMTNHVVDECIRVLEEEIVCIRENQEPIIQQHVEEEVSRLS
ncbi:hypothetical protein GH714_020452 [Hevea brasiliensis]|uniref:Uncharacterized protein n=1 Tax=Hevea brasiliensis TaxID=3981 RepID=A0A6A6LF07_HEVBR|nr:hypothetical protein GH714_020452 [Hevea brasiliensis]